MLKNITVNVSIKGHYMYLTLKITPQSSLGESNIIIKAWDYRSDSAQSTVLNALQIIKWQSSLS